jgi:hypothetical protein
MQTPSKAHKSKAKEITPANPKAKSGGASSPLTAAAFHKPVKEAKTNREGKKPGERKGRAEGATQVGERAMADSYKADTPQVWNKAIGGDDMPPKTAYKQLKEHATQEKMVATKHWISGHIDTKKHNEIHERANHILRKGGSVMGRGGSNYDVTLPKTAKTKEKGPIG